MSSRTVSFTRDEIQELLLKSVNYREFIQEWMSLRKKRGERFGYADISRRAGFASRSFPRDVALNNKKLSLQSMDKFIVGMGLSGDLAQYFKVLTEMEHPEWRSRTVKSEKNFRTLENLKWRLLQKERVASSEEMETAAFQVHNVPRIYAALGSKEKGATFEEIRKRTGLPKTEILGLIQILIKAKLLKEVNGSYFPIEGHLNFAGMKKNEFFKKFFLRLLEEAHSRARAEFETDRNLFFSSCFSIYSKDLPKLKSELRSVLLNYVDHVEAPEGDQVVSIACALFE